MIASAPTAFAFADAPAGGLVSTRRKGGRAPGDDFYLLRKFLTRYISPPMGTPLGRELRQGKPFANLEEEVFLNVPRTGDALLQA